MTTSPIKGRGLDIREDRHVGLPDAPADPASQAAPPADRLAEDDATHRQGRGRDFSGMPADAAVQMDNIAGEGGHAAGISRNEAGTNPCRIQLRRSRGWRMPEGAVHVARPSAFGNPWKAGDPATVDVHFESAPVRFVADVFWRGPYAAEPAEWAVACFRQWLEHDHPPLPDNLTAQGIAEAKAGFHARRAAVLARLAELRGRPLAYWCQPGSPCHADVLLELANR